MGITNAKRSARRPARRLPRHRRPDAPGDPRPPARRPNPRQRARERVRSEPPSHLEALARPPRGATRRRRAHGARAPLPAPAGGAQARGRMDRGVPRLLASKLEQSQTPSGERTMSTKVKSGARAVADIEQGRILASVEIAAPAERVFRELTTG